MNIRIVQEKGCFRHNNAHYIYGEVINGVEDELAERLINIGIAVKSESINHIENKVTETERIIKAVKETEPIMSVNSVDGVYSESDIVESVPDYDKSESIQDTQSAVDAIISSGTTKKSKRQNK